MKLFFSIFFTFLLSACQSTSLQTTAPVELSSEEVLDNTQIVSNSGVVKHANVTKSVEVEVPFAERHYDNLWLKLAEGFEFEVPDNPRIAAQRDYYLKHPAYLQRVSKRAEPFLWLIVEQIENNNLPLEIALLPIVESAFDPFAYSPAGASGLWQFMPTSGQRFGLQQDWWYDGRRDVYASTRSALNYMQVLHNYLGKDWLYAFAAYNSGEGRVERAIRKNKKAGKPTDYWSLSLPKETQKYVPKFLALVDILRNHEAYGIELPHIPNTQALTYVDIESQMDLAYAAELSELTVSEIQLLNPAFNHWATSPEGPHRLLLPTAIAEQFSNKLAKIDKSQRIRWDRYLVRSGDSLSVIAQRKQTTTRVLKQINDLDSSFIKVGQALLIPIATKEQQQNLSLQAEQYEKIAATSATTNKKVIHKVVEGDTLWDISKEYKVTSMQIAKWNGFNVKKTLRLGEKLTIWKAVPTLAITQDKNITRKVTYHVRSGDSLGGIAQKFKVKTADLIRWNKIKNSKYIKIGQQLQVYVDVTKSNT
ncbi:LysM peptidoglycan-binding domain-containing protein [Psychromonas sp. 14N.309.X.WAT.B.A12]|uniref:LysM peptidoglycan-binding domain-containing protein n=1 Tax=unclassified Psychromonas TaxID=2614957 RepID=UPI0025AFD61D|nr:LysM peptidoglycan-binding domain-containing protein [Psychromonas sp. 14N.309.X.WAT.B.A12]MDN2662779.1 LysM peptidoglycan-binding domain-containing protein [Psychromonas sp. 14N.309.X.WAT.B.A12]